MADAIKNLHIFFLFFPKHFCSVCTYVTVSHKSIESIFEAYLISVQSLVWFLSFLSLHNSLVPAQKTLLGVNLTTLIELGDSEKEHNTVEVA